MPTHIKLQDGVCDGARQLTELTLRDFTFADFLALAFFDFSKLSDALRYIALLSGESIDDISLMTQDDVVIAIDALGEHALKFNQKAGL